MYAKARIGLLALVALFVLLPSAGKSQSRQRMAVPEDMERWIKTVFAKGHVPPFSFVYDGKPSGARNTPDNVVRYEGRAGEFALFEEHRYPMPFAAFEIECGERCAAASLFTLPSPLADPRYADHW